MSMVACLACKSVVWAYDHEPIGLSGIMNMLDMPCGNCGTRRMFDGWDHPGLGWPEMHKIAEEEGLAWRADGYNRWFGDQTSNVSLFVVERRMLLQTIAQAIEEERP